MIKVTKLSMTILRSTGNYDHNKLGIEVEVADGEDVEEVRKIVEAYLELSVIPEKMNRVKQSLQIIKEVTDHNDYRYTTAMAILVDNKEQIELARKLVPSVGLEGALPWE
jgi:hypothetical protein